MYVYLKFVTSPYGATKMDTHRSIGIARHSNVV